MGNVMIAIAEYTEIPAARTAYKALTKHMQVPVLRRAIGPWATATGEPVFPGRQGVEILAIYRKTIAAVVDQETIILHPEAGAKIQFMVYGRE